LCTGEHFINGSSSEFLLDQPSIHFRAVIFDGSEACEACASGETKGAGSSSINLRSDASGCLLESPSPGKIVLQYSGIGLYFATFSQY
jgi:hypothetical protein